MNTKYILIGGIILIVCAAAFYFFRNQQQERPAPQAEGSFSIDGEQWTRHNDGETGVQFAYRTEPDGYALDVRDGREDSAALRTYVLMEKRELSALASSTAPRELPPAITLQVFRNTDNATAGVWAAEHIESSNLDLAMTEVGGATVAGAQAIRYRATGLYTTDNVIIAHGGFIYVASGAFLTEDSQIRRDFEPFVNSIVFIP